MRTPSLAFDLSLEELLWGKAQARRLPTFSILPGTNDVDFEGQPFLRNLKHRSSAYQLLLEGIRRLDEEAAIEDPDGGFLAWAKTKVLDAPRFVVR